MKNSPEFSELRVKRRNSKRVDFESLSTAYDLTQLIQFEKDLRNYPFSV